ncbi:PREDICTED: uncharacterized protein LOC104609720 [Nelumbo nucifera]|uniref:DUF7950 domain-containing protein n=2 Tax=Nelumbo nucifera TaxID=4432 RepID=A0A822XQC4_NELNU|nr:PREDICTED: uncharacterized protein LOC104609720 [Nelumbo nucifera]DAD21299.1 TPA_asm: hypothetical protein HUJ06_022762 [Nelumbo nucifera]
MTHNLVGLLRHHQEGSMKETMLMNSLNIYSSSSKTDEIMSRYRPIAPKPHIPIHPLLDGPTTLKNLSPRLPTRPSRARKRNRTGISPATLKRAGMHLRGFSSPCHTLSLAKNALLGLSLQSLAHGFLSFPTSTPSIGIGASLEEATAKASHLATLTFLSRPCSVPVAAKSTPEMDGINLCSSQTEEKILDLNTSIDIPEERNLLHEPPPEDPLQKLQEPPNCPSVITPQPVRPIGSSISVGFISEYPSPSCAMRTTKRPEEVEEEVESEALPAIVSDSNNRVRLANSAYKEMVGQPECPWLDATYDGASRGRPCKRIGGEVMLDIPGSNVPIYSNGFSCRVRIEWGTNGKKSSITAPCDVIRLSCNSKNYLFTWRFHTSETSEGSSNA